MAETVDLDAIRKLSVSQRLAIIDLIWDTISEVDVPTTISEVAMAEMKRRAQELRENPESGDSHEEVKAWLRSKSWR